MPVTYCCEYQFDRNDPVNHGVVKDSFGGFPNTTSTFRIIDYIDPETSETFYTTMNRKIGPGVICWINFLRWKIERTFDCFKNALREKKAWAVGLKMHYRFKVAVFVLYTILSGFFQKQYG